MQAGAGTRSAHVQRRRWPLIAAYAALLLSCDNPLAPGGGSIGRVEVSPRSAEVGAGNSVAFTARVFDAGGQERRNSRVFWSTQNPGVATVSQAGVVTGVSDGLVQIAASSGGQSGLATITVRPRPVALVRVSPSPANVVAGSTRQLTAEPLDASGGLLTGRPVLWASSSSDIATVSSTGLVTGVAAGTATITATAEGVDGAAVVTVTAVPVASIALSPPTASVTAGHSLQLFATPVDERGQPLPGRVITWSSDNSTIATVSSTGLVVGITPGHATITATSETRSATAQINVGAVPVDSVELSPDQATIAAGSTLQLSVRLADASGNVLGARALSFVSDQPAIATVSPVGLVTGIGQGQVRITATAEGKSDEAVMTVTPVAIARIDLAPASVSVTVGQTTQLAAIAVDGQGNSLAGRQFTWITGAPSVATVNQAGMVSALSSGTAVIFAASEGLSANTTVNVTTVAVAQVRVTPTAASIVQGGFAQLTAQPLDGSGNVLAGRLVTWTSSNQTVAVVSGSGRVQSVAAGSATITATVEGVSGASAITVTPAAIAIITITPLNPTISPGQSTQLTAIARDANGTVLPGRALSWGSTNTAVVTVNSSGFVTGVAQGVASVAAFAEGITGSTSVIVSAIPVASVSVTPAASAIVVGQKTPLAATAFDGGGNILTGRPVTWASSNATIASVDAAGEVTGVASGTVTITATIGGVSGAASVAVSQVPVASIAVTPSPSSVEEKKTLQLTATARDGSNNILVGRTIVWASSDNSIAAVSQNGVVTGIAPGTATITASAPNGGVGGTTPSGTTLLTVTFAPVATVLLTPASAAVIVGSTATFTASLFDALAQPLGATGRTVAWASLDPAIATVNGAGVATGVGNGTARIVVVASSPAQAIAARDTSTLNVSNVPVASVTVAPGSPAIIVGQTVQLTSTARDAANNVLIGRTVTWTSSSPAFASVNATGLVTGVATGSATVTATVDGISGSSTVTVSQIPIATITVAPPAASLNVGATQNLTATARDASNNILVGRTIVWASTNNAVAAVSQTGVVTGVGAGSTTVTATSPGGGAGGSSPSGSSTITVTLVPVATVQVVPSTATVTVGFTTNYTVNLLDAGGQPLSPAGRTIAWSSNATGIATVNASTGVVTAVAPGSATITATVTTPGQAGSELGTATVTVTNIPVATVTVSPTAPAIIVGQTVPLAATARDAANNVLTGRPVTWSSSNAAVASVNASGVVTGVTTGSVTVTATVDGVSGASTVTVSQVPVATITVTPGTATLNVGATQPLTATARDAGNNVLVGRTIVWASSNNAVAAVSQTGVVTAVGAGSASITATSPGGGAGGSSPSGSSTVTVTLVPVATVQVVPSSATVTVGFTTNYTVNLFDAGGQPLSTAGRTVAWTSNNVSAATINGGTGVVTGVAPGSATITATVTTPGQPGSVLGTATVTVTNIPVASVTVSPTTPAIIVGQTVQITATARDGNNNVLTGRTVNWSSSSAAVATVNATGLVTGVATGSTTVTATVDGVSGASTVSVSQVPVATITVTPANAALNVGATQNLTATARDASNNILVGRAIVWASTNNAVAAVSQTGVVTGVGAGSATITATSPGGGAGGSSPSGSSAITVALVPVVTVQVVPSTATVTVGFTTNYTVNLLDAGGQPLSPAGRTIAWSSSAVGIATVNANTGVVTGVAPGNATITATVTTPGQPGSVLGTATVTVENIPVATVTVAPTAPAIIVGQTVQLTATARDGNNNVLIGRTVNWSSSSTAVATVNATGLVTGVATGSTTVTATVDGISGSSTVTVSQIPIATITVAPPTASLNVGATQNLTATARDASNNILVGRTIVWASTNNAVAAVSQTGVVTGVGAGSTTVTATSPGGGAGGSSPSGSSTITVTLVPVATVQVVPSTATVTVGFTTNYTVNLLDAGGQPLSTAGRTIAWSSSATGIATVNASTGVVTAVAPGSATITATVTTPGQAGSVLGTATVTVTNIPVATVTVSPTAPAIIVGQTVQITATARDASNNILTGRTITWSSSNAAVATVNGTGLVTGVASGSVTVSATVDAVSGASTVTVSQVPIATVTVTPGTASLNVGGTQPLTATARDAGNNILTGRTIVWASTNNAIAAVSQTGVVTAVGAGNATITATSPGGGAGGSSPSGSSAITVALVPVATVLVVPPSETVTVGLTTSFTVNLLDAGGQPLTTSGRTVAWSTSNAAVATVNASTGVVTGVAPGSATITATVTTPGQAGSVLGTASVTVTNIPVASVTVAPATPAIIVGQTVQLTATARDAANNILTGRTVSWTSSSPASASVNGTGLVTGVATGSATITATVEGISGTSTVTVSQIPIATITVAPPTASLSVGATQNLTATARDASNNILVGRTIVWASTNNAVAAVSQTGVVTGVGAGSTTVTATSPGGGTGGSSPSGSSTITVTLVPVATVQVVPSTATVTLGFTTNYTVNLLDAGGQPLSPAGRTIVWSSNATGIATVNASTGVVTAVAPGSATITATVTTPGQAGSVLGTATVTVTNIPVATVTVSPTAPAIIVGQTVQLTATARDASNNILTGRTVTWTSSSTSVATVNASGLVTAVAAGAATITATVDGISGFSTVSVSVTPINAIAVTPSPSSIVEGLTVQLTATATDAQSNVLTGRTIVWASSNTSIAGVSQTGLVSGIVPGSVTILAFSPGGGAGGSSPSGTATVSVTFAPVSSVTVIPSSAIAVVGNNAGFSATMRDAGGNVLSGAGRSLSWSSSSTGVATISASTGVATAVTSGTTTITATASSPGQAIPAVGTAALSVTNVPVAQVLVAPSSATIHVGTLYKRQFTAQTLDGQGNALAGRTVIWTSTDLSRALVDPATGEVTGVGSGAVTIRANSEGIIGSAAVTINLVQVLSATVTATDSSIFTGQSVQATVVPKDSAGNAVSLTGRTVIWNSTAPTVASVSSSGLVTAHSSGSTTISVSVDGQNAAFILNVSLVPVNSVSVTPATESVGVAASKTLTANVRDASSAPLAGRSCTITSADTNFVTVSPSSANSNTSGQFTFSVTGVATTVSPISVTVTCATVSGTAAITVS